jgi:hypothetical protein
MLTRSAGRPDGLGQLVGERGLPRGVGTVDRDADGVARRMGAHHPREAAEQLDVHGRQTGSSAW